MCHHAYLRRLLLCIVHDVCRDDVKYYKESILYEVVSTIVIVVASRECVSVRTYVR